jgi:hypothetical protein
MEEYPISDNDHTNISIPERKTGLDAQNPDNISKTDKTIPIELLISLYRDWHRNYLDG